MSLIRAVRPGLLAGLGLTLFSLAGCHSAFIQATVANQSGAPIRLFEVDYPSASFGAGELAPGAVFQYRFKILGGGPTKFIWTDAAQHDHTNKGPDLQEGQEGDLRIVLQPGNKVSWDSSLHTR